MSAVAPLGGPAQANVPAAAQIADKPAAPAVMVSPTQNEAKILDLTKRMLKMSTASKVSRAECASAHFHCLASVALEDAGGDKVKAAEILRHAMTELVLWVESPQFQAQQVIHNGQIRKK